MTDFYTLCICIIEESANYHTFNCTFDEETKQYMGQQSHLALKQNLEMVKKIERMTEELEEMSRQLHENLKFHSNMHWKLGDCYHQSKYAVTLREEVDDGERRDIDGDEKERENSEGMRRKLHKKNSAISCFIHFVLLYFFPNECPGFEAFCWDKNFSKNL